VYAPATAVSSPEIQVRPVRHLRDALSWAGRRGGAEEAKNGL
jgi:hypothetical protein